MPTEHYRAGRTMFFAAAILAVVIPLIAVATVALAGVGQAQMAQPAHEQPSATTRPAEAAVVKLLKTDRGFELRRNGEPFFIRGAGGRARLDELAAAGANSVRTWNTRRLPPVLDRAHELGLAVCLGIWLPQVQAGFDYADAEQVARLREHVRTAVTTYKDHPAVLLWGLGNEMEGDGNDPAAWKVVNDFARMVKEIDPDHPTMTVICEPVEHKISQFNKYCPDVDILGVNAYGDLARIAPMLEKQGRDRPYIITEFGPLGWWQTKKSSWGAELEQTSMEKAQTYRDSYHAAVSSQPGKCLGAYAFLWGNKQEHTYTWFSMILPTGERTASVDEMIRIWTGKYPTPRCPEIQGIYVVNASEKPAAEAEHIYPSGAQLECRVRARSLDGEELTVRWELRSESGDKKSGGRREERPPDHPDSIVRTSGYDLVLKLPDTPGSYRLFVVVTGDDNNAATANVPILVR